MAIEWEETVETTRRVALVVDLKPSEPFDAPDEVRAATIDDLRRACEAAGLELFTAQHKADCEDARSRLDHACQQHAEDLEKLGREMNEVVAQRDEARDIVASARELAGAEESESLGHAITRILGREDHERGAHLRLLDEVIAFGEVIGTKPDESIASAARRVVRERDAAIARGRAVYNLGRDAARGEVARMREEVAAANAHAEPAYRTVKSIGEILSVEPDYEKVTDKVRDTANEVATLRDRVDGLEIDLNSAVQNSKANEVEANNLRSANRTLRDRVAELEAIAREAESQANDMVAQKIAALGMAVNGAEDEEMVSPDVQVVRGDFVMTKFRERLARIDAASPPAPQGQPVATDEELSDLDAARVAAGRKGGA